MPDEPTVRPFGPAETPLVFDAVRRSQVLAALSVVGASLAAAAVTSSVLRVIALIGGVAGPIVVLVVHVDGYGLDEWCHALCWRAAGHWWTPTSPPAKHGRGRPTVERYRYHLGDFPLQSSEDRAARVAALARALVAASTPGWPAQLLVETASRTPLVRTSTLVTSRPVDRSLLTANLESAGPADGRTSLEVPAGRGEHGAGAHGRRVLWIRAWPTGPSAAAFLTPFLVEPSWSTFLLSFEVESPMTVLRRLERHQVGAIADETLRTRGGFRSSPTAATRAQHRGRLEHALHAGATPVRFTALVVVEGVDRKSLDERVAATVAAARRCGLDCAPALGAEVRGLCAIANPSAGLR